VMKRKKEPAWSKMMPFAGKTKVQISRNESVSIDTQGERKRGNSKRCRIVLVRPSRAGRIEDPDRDRKRPYKSIPTHRGGGGESSEWETQIRRRREATKSGETAVGIGNPYPPGENRNNEARGSSGGPRSPYHASFQVRKPVVGRVDKKIRKDRSRSAG